MSSILVGQVPSFPYIVSCLVDTFLDEGSFVRTAFVTQRSFRVHQQRIRESASLYWHWLNHLEDVLITRIISQEQTEAEHHKAAHKAAKLKWKALNRSMEWKALERRALEWKARRSM